MSDPTATKPEPLTEPSEMRKLLLHVGRTGCRMDETARNYSAVGALTRRVQELAHHLGLSGEDAMTVLAYHALLQLEAAYDREIHRLTTTIPPGLMLGENLC